MPRHRRPGMLAQRRTAGSKLNPHQPSRRDRHRDCGISGEAIAPARCAEEGSAENSRPRSYAKEFVRSGRKVSFAPAADAVAATGMEFGSITPFGAPAGWPIRVDAPRDRCPTPVRPGGHASMTPHPAAASTARGQRCHAGSGIRLHRFVIGEISVGGGPADTKRGSKLRNGFSCGCQAPQLLLPIWTELCWLCGR